MSSTAEIKTAALAMKEKTAFFLSGADHYRSEKIFDVEFEKVYSRDWIYAAHVSQLPNKGDYLKFGFAGEEIVVVRGEGNQFFANLNVCAHRGYRLCSEARGNVRAFVCGYHQWSFNLDGSLKRVPQMLDGEYFDYCKHGLKTAQVEVWNGMIFIHLGSGAAEPLHPRLAPTMAAVQRFAPERTRLAHEKNYAIAGNWKIVVENAMECYHCAGNHPSLCSVIDVPGLIADLKLWLDDQGGGNDNALAAGGMRVKKGMKTMSPDGDLICGKLLGNLTAEDAAIGITAGVMVIPNFFVGMFYVDHWWTIAIRPKSATETELLYQWFVRDDAVEGEDYDVQRLIEVADNTQTEDNVLIERTQRGVNSRYYVPGPIGSDVEPALYDVLLNYKKFMEA